MGWLKFQISGGWAPTALKGTGNFASRCCAYAIISENELARRITRPVVAGGVKKFSPIQILDENSIVGSVQVWRHLLVMRSC